MVIATDAGREGELVARWIIEKCGFKYEGTIRKTYEIYDGTLRDSLVFSILREEYDELQK